MAKIIFCAILLLFGVIVSDLFVSGYNLDTYNIVHHWKGAKSMFGFSVALHQENSQSWVIVGAPKTDTSYFQRGVTEAGAVYRCEYARHNSCDIIEFDSMGNQLNELGQQVDTKSFQWFGATVASAGIDGPVVACAPRYVFHSMKPHAVDRVEPVGTCYIARHQFTEFTEYSPCRTMYYGYHRQGSCQAGLSAAISKDGQRVYIGAPGSWYWQGQVYSINTNAVYPFKPTRDAKFGEGQLFSQSALNSQLHPSSRVYETKESSAAEDDSYLGYSTITGDFNGDGHQDVAVGMPRGAGLLGKILIMSWDLHIQQNITGEQIGAYFGYSMCSVDVDGDGLEDLIVGAPMYSDYTVNIGDYENGRVYIIYQGKTRKFKELETREGAKSRARFGLALTSLGDINQDGFGDFAVGAPYDGVDGKGAVYIYNGSPGGVLKKYSQVLYAEDAEAITPRPAPHNANVTTFGFSLSGGIDLDRNGYPDLVVGAYQSGTATIFKSRPVVQMEGEAVFLTTSKLIALEKKECEVPYEKRFVTCTNIKFCLRYSGKNVPKTISVNATLYLDTKSLHSPRMFFLGSSTNRATNVRNYTVYPLHSNQDKKCYYEKVFIAENIRDKLTPLEIELHYDINPKYSETSLRSKRDIKGPILDQNRGTVQRDSINIQKNCGPDNICIPNLRLEVHTIDEYLLGSKEPLEVEVIISNLGEDAFEAGFYMNIPSGLSFKRVEKMGDIKDSTITCNNPTIDNILKCDVGNPLQSEAVSHFKVLLNYKQQNNMVEPKFAFQMNVNSTNPELSTTTLNNVFSRNITIFLQSVLKIDGASDPIEFHYNSSQFLDIANASREQDIGEQVVHKYHIQNLGVSEIEEVEVVILWSHETNDGEPLMYLLDQAEEHGNIQCSYSYDVNPRDLIIDRQLSRKSYFTTYDAVRSSITNQWAHATRNFSSQTGGSTSGSSSSYNYTYSSNSSSTGGQGSGGHIIIGGSSSGAGHGGAAAGGSTSGGTVMTGSQGGQVIHGTSRVQTKEERQKIFEMEETKESVGDASEVHRERARQAAAAAAAAAAAGQGHGHRQGVYTSYYNSSTARDPKTNQMKTVEFSTEHYGGLGDAASFNSRLNELRQGGQQSVAQGSRGTQSSNSARGGGTTYVHGHSNHSTSQSGQTTSSGHVSGQSSHTGQGQAGNQDVITYSGYYPVSSGNQQQTGTVSQHNVQNNISGLFQGSDAQSFGTSVSSSTTSGSGNTMTSGRRRMLSQQDDEPPMPELVAISSGLHKMAQNRGGFQTSTLDLEINRGNVDSEVRQSSNAQMGGGTQQSGVGTSGYQVKYYSHGGSTGGSTAETMGSGSQGSGSSTHSSSTSGNTRQQSSSSFSQSSSGGSSSSSTGQMMHSKQNPLITDHYYENVDQRIYPNAQNVNSRSEHHRYRRETIDNTFLGSIQCNSTKCAALRCVAKELTMGKGAWIALRMRLVAKTMKKISGHSPLKLSTLALARVTKLPYIGTPENAKIQTHELFVTAIPEPIIKPKVVPLWIIILAAVVGTLILLLLIFLLYKCGFFNRKRPSDSQERQPLNRNGGYHGDEHL